MERTDIKIFVRKSSVTIITEKNQITFSLSGEGKTHVSVFITAEFSMQMLDCLEQSKIVRVERYKYDVESGTMRLQKLLGYAPEILQDVFLDIVEKHNL